MMPTGAIVMHGALQKYEFETSPLHTLGRSRWQSVCIHRQVFTKNWINSSAKPAAKRAPVSALFQIDQF
jgi:hypothetical protein